MFFAWLKQYMPRNLYGRAALILLLPVVTLQLAVSVAFIQRHFANVTDQLTRAVVLELRYFVRELEAAEDAGEDAAAVIADIGRPLRLNTVQVSEQAIPRADFKRWYDLTGARVIGLLREDLRGVRAVVLPDDRTVMIYLQTEAGPIEVRFHRDRVSASNPHQLLVILVVLGALLSLVSYVFLRNQLRPIKRLGIAAEAFGKGRHVPYKPAGAVEVRAAGNAFLDMRARIERQIEQRTLMLSGVSHDLRTPLTRLKLGLSMLDSDEREPMERDVEEMQRLLDAFLDFARGEAEGEPEAVDPFELVAQLAEDSRRAGQDVTIAQCQGEGTVPLRPVAIRRALENLIGNAVRYGTRAEVCVVLSDRSLRLTVEDDGPGIPAELRGEALKPFARLEPARNQNRGAGVGLGLAIAADIARAHGGVLRLGDSARLGGLKADIVIAR